MMLIMLRFCFAGLCDPGTDCTDCTIACTDTCVFANDASCDDGTDPSSDFAGLCDLGTDCTDCTGAQQGYGGEEVPEYPCTDTCAFANEDSCDDGTDPSSPSEPLPETENCTSLTSIILPVRFCFDGTCELGTDCTDCSQQHRTQQPIQQPSQHPTQQPTHQPTQPRSQQPTQLPTNHPSLPPTQSCPKDHRYGVRWPSTPLGSWVDNQWCY